MDWQARITQLRKQIELDTKELLALEEKVGTYNKQLELRKKYVSSREIIELIARYQGVSKNMTAIKRWADEGLLGASIEEREHFPELVKQRGNKRFLYLRSTVFAFLLARNYIFPRFEVVDQVKWKKPEIEKPLQAVIISSRLQEDQFVYTIQDERTGEVFYNVREDNLELVEEEA